MFFFYLVEIICYKIIEFDWRLKYLFGSGHWWVNLPTCFPVELSALFHDDNLGQHISASPEVGPLGHEAAEEHEKGVGEEVAGVQEAQVGLGHVLLLPVDLCDPRVARGIVGAVRLKNFIYFFFFLLSKIYFSIENETFLTLGSSVIKTHFIRSKTRWKQLNLKDKVYFHSMNIFNQYWSRSNFMARFLEESTFWNYWPWLKRNCPL